MLFPDCRHDDIYNADFLDDENAELLSGYDRAVSEIDNFFDNLDVMPDDTGAVLRTFFRSELPETEKDKYKCHDDFNDMELEREVGTYGDYLRYKLLSWAEMERNAMITSMIDSMDEEALEKNRRVVLDSNSKRENPKEYYNTRKYMCRGVKELSEI